ncbi:nucleoside-diphosphate kinase [Streptomyces sp. NPDC001941]|uniref:nucleoside-diphosphate kinase n=1 Tax=Streptomyces sp. NPDC001941 TaxID=3154659 RepID=UPI00332F41B2
MTTDRSIDWSRCVVVVVSPDSFLRGVGRRVVDEVLSCGCEQLASRVVQPGSLLLDTIYDDLAQRRIHFGTYRYRAIDTLYSLGPSLALLLRGMPQIHGHFTALKGSGALERASPDSLRLRLGAVNTILGLLHASDSPEEAELDWRTFFVRDRNNHGPTDLPDHPDALSSPGARALAALLDRPEGARETRGFPEVREQLRRALVAHLWELLPRPEADVLASELLEPRELSVLPDAPLGDDFLARVAHGLDGHADLLLRRALTSSFTPDQPPLDTERLWRALDGAGISVDPWARAVLTTSQHFPPLRRTPSVPVASRAPGIVAEPVPHA